MILMLLGPANGGVPLARKTARAVFFPMISLWEFQKFKFKRLESASMKIRENLAKAAACHYLWQHWRNDFRGGEPGFRAPKVTLL